MKAYERQRSMSFDPTSPYYPPTPSQHMTTSSTPKQTWRKKYLFKLQPHPTTNFQPPLASTSSSTKVFDWNNSQTTKQWIAKYQNAARNPRAYPTKYRSHTEPFPSSKPIQIPQPTTDRRYKPRHFRRSENLESMEQSHEEDNTIFLMEEETNDNRNNSRQVMERHERDSWTREQEEDDDEEDGFVPPHQMVERDCFSLGMNHHFRHKPIKI